MLYINAQTIKENYCFHNEGFLCIYLFLNTLEKVRGSGGKINTLPDLGYEVHSVNQSNVNISLVPLNNF